MPNIELDRNQRDALLRLNNGSILCGGVGSGKSRVSLAYYYMKNGGDINSNYYVKMTDPCDLYIITTAKKRDQKEWEKDMLPFRLTTDKESMYDHKVVVDSWNNIGKYADVKNAFFIFDEQRVVGYGVWVKAFLKIAKSNQWILATATPGDSWSDYLPVFIANGFFKNKTEFESEHVVYSRIAKYPKIDRYIGTQRLRRFRDSILVHMAYTSPAIEHHTDVHVDYDSDLYKTTMRTRFDPYKNVPFKTIAEMCYCLRKIVNSDISRSTAVLEIVSEYPRVIIFYSFDYELEILKSLYYGDGYIVAEWNGHKHQPIPDSDKWIYLVQYTSGAEGWNCTDTNAMIFYSQNYSYKILTQSCGRINRRTTRYKDLYYYHLISRSTIDIAISKALDKKQAFNENSFFKFGGLK